MKLLDLFCGAGGAAMGYHRAGFDEIVGVDIEPMPRYPFTFIQADALQFLDSMIDGEEDTAFDLIHASPPCQAYSFATIQHRHNDYPDLVAPTRAALELTDRPYVIENVPGAPLGYSITLCGSTLGLDRIKRHRHFECSWPMMSPGCNHDILREPLSVIGHNEPGRTYRQRTLPKNLEARKEAMGIDWMNRDELSESIPPAYTEFLGRQFLAHLDIQRGEVGGVGVVLDSGRQHPTDESQFVGGEGHGKSFRLTAPNPTQPAFGVKEVS